MTTRLYAVALVFAAASVGIGWITRPEARQVRTPLRELSPTVGGWNGRDNVEFDAKTLAVLGVDDYITRMYVGGGAPVSLYVGYYESQRTGDTMHSPMRCLPGSGWQPLNTRVQEIELDSVPGHAQSIRVNRYLVQKDLRRHIVLFWYQMHGRVLASEYATKFFLIQDAVRLNRTDGALVRLIVPVTEEGGESTADRVATAFVRALFPLLTPHLPA
jgi:EpsI family protein